MIKEISNRLFARRQVLLMGAAGVLTLTGLGRNHGTAFAQSTIVQTPSLTEGPYFVDELLNRSDISIDPMNGSIQQGFPLLLRIVVSSIDNGTLSPVPGAYVDVWHCNAAGLYSDVQANNGRAEISPWLSDNQSTGRGSLSHDLSRMVFRSNRAHSRQGAFIHRDPADL